MRDGGADALYKFRNNELTNYLQQKKDIADSMKIYTYSMIQTANWMTEHKLLSLPDQKVK
jgi:hypothetical protein